MTRINIAKSIKMKCIMASRKVTVCTGKQSTLLFLCKTRETLYEILIVFVRSYREDSVISVTIIKQTIVNQWNLTTMVCVSPSWFDTQEYVKRFWDYDKFSTLLISPIDTQNTQIKTQINSLYLGNFWSSLSYIITKAYHPWSVLKIVNRMQGIDTWNSTVLKS
jgi:hypothetical protein